MESAVFGIFLSIILVVVLFLVGFPLFRKAKTGGTTDAV